MTSPRRQREWRNETNLLTPAANTQASVGIASGVFEKGCTMVRMLLDIYMTPVTLDVNSQVYIAVWAGRTTPPTTISSSTNRSYLLWTHALLRKTSGEGQDWFRHLTYDLRGQRRSRDDDDSIFFIVQPDSASAVNCYLASRTLCLLA